MAVNSRKFVGYIAHGRLRSVRLTEPTMTTNLPGNLSLADTKYGAQAAASGSRIYRSKYEDQAEQRDDFKRIPVHPQRQCSSSCVL